MSLASILHDTKASLFLCHRSLLCWGQMRLSEGRPTPSWDMVRAEPFTGSWF